MSPETPPAAEADPFDPPRLCRHFSERSPQPMAAVEGGTHVVRYVNPAFTRLVGRGADSLVGRPFGDAVPEGDENGCLGLLDRVFRTGVPDYLTEQEHRNDQPSSVYWSYAVWAILGADDRPAGVVVQVTDATETAVYRLRAVEMNQALVVSSVRQHELIDDIRRGERERRELEARVSQAQKLESLGVLAGGIAHDLNNMLTPVLGFTELAADALPAGSPAAPLLGEVVLNVRRAADLVQQILAFAGKGRFVVEPVDVSRLVRDMGGLLGAAVPAHATLAYDLASAIPPVEADATQLRQVVMNLVVNACEAVGEGGGTVTVRTGSIPVGDRPPPSTPPTDPATGPAVFLEVADTGCGMTLDVAGKAFDPFFTTKFTGRGLGLAVVQGVARGHRGTLQIQSEPGGSTFRLLLPCSAEAAAAPTVSGPPAAWRGVGTVLVVDDERGIRDLASRILKRAGLAVLVAGDGAEGVKVFEDHQGEIAAAVLDLTMPGMGGLEAAKALRTLWPDLPVVLMSGFSVQELTSQSAGLGITGFVQKPFSNSDLLAAVRRALGQ